MTQEQQAEAIQLLKDLLKFLNEVPRRRIADVDYDSYQLAAKVSKLLEEAGQ